MDAQFEKPCQTNYLKVYRQLKNLKLYVMLLSDALLIVLALYIAFMLRFEFQLPPVFQRQLIRLLPYTVVIKLLVFYTFGLYRGFWRYTTVRDFWQIAKASAVASLVLITVVSYLYRFYGFSRSIFILDTFLTFLLIGTLRITIRSAIGIKFTGRELLALLVPWNVRPSQEGARALIIGAGSAGEKILREIEENRQLDYTVVAFIDDDPQKIGRVLHGVPVLGPVEVLPRAVLDLGVNQVLIAIPSADGQEMRRIVSYCEQAGARFKILPGYGEILNDRVSIKTLRDVNFNDLLRRKPIELDVEDIRSYLAGRVVCVTGCGGSIGSELCRQLVRFEPASLLLLDASEANLFGIQMQLLHDLNFNKIIPILGKVQDQALVKKIFDKYLPQVVFHAAAYKHVPMLEINPWEAVFNNILGSKIVMEMAAKSGVRRFVLVSTDKAVRPTNVMGASKRVAEMLLQSFSGGATHFVAVRFGNVIGSSGSVIPLFRSQIEKGGPVTVTHPEITRYFMTIPEAAQLVIQAGGMGQGGEIFVLEMGTPVKIVDMARDLIRLSGKEPDRDIEIKFTGLRDGEKLYEELITTEESVVKTDHRKIMVLRANGYAAGLNSQAEFQQWLEEQLQGLYQSASNHDAVAIKQKLSELVPEYNRQETGSNL